MILKTIFTKVHCPECQIRIDLQPISMERYDKNPPHKHFEYKAFFFCDHCNTVFEVVED